MWKILDHRFFNDLTELILICATMQRLCHFFQIKAEDLFDAISASILLIVINENVVHHISHTRKTGHLLCVEAVNGIEAWPCIVILLTVVLGVRIFAEKESHPLRQDFIFIFITRGLT